MSQPKPKWYETAGEMGDIVVSTRVRLARNIDSLPFPGRMSREQEERLVDLCAETLTKSAGGSEFTEKKISGLTQVEALAMVERHLISPELAASGGKLSSVVLSRDESVSVMINEEDHLRIQVMGSGLCLGECYEKAERIDDLLEASCGFAFDEKLGYLTRCPTNLGTGLRASVMLHLPALTVTREMNGFIAACGKLGFAVRGLYGEGSAAEGSMYQVSNQLTVGLSEQETLDKLAEVVKSILERERELRKHIIDNSRLLFEDEIWRAVGILATARRLPSAEAMRHLSSLRTGVAVGIIKEIDLAEINRLFGSMQPNCLSLSHGGEFSPEERDVKRAELMRSVAMKALGGNN